MKNGWNCPVMFTPSCFWTWLTAGCFQCEEDCTRHASISLPLLALSPAPGEQDLRVAVWRCGTGVGGWEAQENSSAGKRQVTFRTLNLIALGSPLDSGQDQPM